MNRPPKPVPMLKKLDDAIDKQEKALGAFVDSLTKSNPSEKLAADLMEADRELSATLKELEAHQNNAARIRKLQEETDAYDLQIKNIVQNLWEMRKELKSTPATTYGSSKPKHTFTTEELLAYARRISRQTLPPPGVTNGVDLSFSNNPRSPSPINNNNNNNNNTSAQTPNPSASFVGTPSASTPAPTTMTTTTAPTAPGAAPPTPSNNVNGGTGTTANTPLPSQQPQAGPSSSFSVPQLPPHLQPQLNPTANAPFFPWPTMEQIRSGALMKCHNLVIRGIDPKNYDPEEEERKKKEEEQARKEADERARQEMEERQRRMREERERMIREREAARQAEAAAAGAAGGSGETGAGGAPGGGGGIAGPSGAAAGAPPGSAQRPAAKQFTFLDADDDDDDDEDD